MLDYLFFFNTILYLYNFFTILWNDIMNGELLLYQRFIANANFIFHHLQPVTSINNKKKFLTRIILTYNF